MADHLLLDVLDEEAPIEEETAARADFLAKAVVAGGALVSGGVLIGGLPPLAVSAPSPAQDVQILNFALLLEYLEAAFYKEALARGKLKGELRQFAETVGAHERAHVAFIRTALGTKARRKPSFDFRGTTRNARTFAKTALALEDTGVAALNGQAPNLTKGTLAAAAKIVSVEARHAAWIRDILELNPAPRASDQPMTAKQATAALNRTRFVRSS